MDTGAFRLDSLLGYRYYRYDEGLRIRQVINPTGANFVPGTQILSGDDFSTKNEVNGLDLGLRARFTWDQLTMTVLAKVAVGRVQRYESISGGTTTLVPGQPAVNNNGGLLALSSNSGVHPNGDWAAMPDGST